ncbi:MAG: hypothetical protein M3198_17490 [Actinomycetota bacterium]|nr:hypothetical protein [Actinomycetota bacterium]
MAQIDITPGELARIEEIAAELDGVVDDFFRDARRILSCDQWGLLTGYACACVRRALELGVLLHGVVDAHASCRLAYPGRGREVFVKAGLDAWRDSFAPMAEVWRLAPVLELVPGGESRVMADVETLEVMAANRMFVSLEDQCAEFLGSEGRP